MPVSMNNVLKYIYQDLVVEQSDISTALLLYKDQIAYDTLKQMHDKAKSKGHNTIWIENSKDQLEFWTRFWNGLDFEKPEQPDYVMNSSYNLSEIIQGAIIKYDLHPQLFIPNLEKVFYDFDIANRDKKARFNACLRTIWQDPESSLSIFASVWDNGTEAFDKTLNEYKYPFYSSNFRNIRVKE